MALPQLSPPTTNRRHPPDWTAEQQADHRAELAAALGVCQPAAGPRPIPSPPAAVGGPQTPPAAGNGLSASWPWPPQFDPEDGYGLDPAEVADEQRFKAEWHADQGEEVA